jgi:hypothetical protein
MMLKVPKIQKIIFCRAVLYKSSIILPKKVTGQEGFFRKSDSDFDPAVISFTSTPHIFVNSNTVSGYFTYIDYTGKNKINTVFDTKD